MVGDEIHSGNAVAPLVHRGDHASIGEGPDSSLWILLHDPERRPRGRNPGIVIDAEVSYESNGLVRVLDRRLARNTLERLVSDLTGQSVRLADGLARRSRIPEGDYAGLVVEHVESHYRVHATDSDTRWLSNMQALGRDRWLVLAGEESLLRRELVRRLMPFHHRLVWAMIRHGVEMLTGLAILTAVLSLVVPLVTPLAIVAVIALGLFHSLRRQIVTQVRARLVQPHIDRTQGKSGLFSSDDRDVTAANPVQQDKARRGA